MTEQTTKPPRKLTLKQSRFIDEYLINGGNGLKAAEKAGYKGNYNLLGVMAYENLNKPNIANALAVRYAEIKAKNAVKQQITLDFIQEQHLKQFNKLEDNDHSVAFQHLQAAGKTIAAYADVQINPNDNKVIDTARRNYLKSISSHTLSSTLLEDLHNDNDKQTASTALQGQQEARNENDSGCPRISAERNGNAITP
jgi:phage terminase small subunit